MKRALVVDDKEENVYYLKMLLEGHGYAVDMAHNGEEALASALRVPPDVVISDLLMPVMDGYTLLKRWKSNDRLSDIPFIVYTATYTEQNDERLALDLGADAFILKPCEPEAFMACLSDVSQRVAQSGATRPSSSRSEHDLLKAYNASLVQKLEKKLIELQHANEALKQDIDARELAEAALRASEHRHRELAKELDLERQRLLAAQAVAQVGSWELDLGATDSHMMWSPQMRTLLDADRTGASPSLAFLSSCIPEPGRAHFEQEVRRAESGDHECRLTHALQSADGRLHVVEHRLQRLGNRLLGTCQDITERVSLEKQLRRAQRLESIGQLTGGVAHDFNNLLTVILGGGEVLMDAVGEDARLRGLAQLIVEAAERGARLTQDLLSYARRQPLQPQVVDVNALISSMDALLKRSLGPLVALEYDTAPDLWFAHADPTQLDNALLNLCLNARDAMPDGGRLVISTANVEVREGDKPLGDLKSGFYVMLAVADAGVGIAPADMERVIEPFFTTKEPGKGTGLGLSMVYGFVKQSNGHLQLESALGTGTTVRLYLPRAEGAYRPSATLTPTPGPAHPGTGTVLVVDDDELVRSVAVEHVTALGYTAIAAGSGQQALEALAKTQGIDLLFTDLAMAGIGGRELAERARAMRPGLKVLYASGFNKEGLHGSRALEADAQFLSKPYRREDLAQKLRLMLAGPSPGHGTG